VPGIDTLTRGEQEKILQAFADHPRFCNESLQIRNKSGSIVPLELSPLQVKLDAAVEKQRAAGKPVRIVILKGRQQYASVGVCSEIWKQIAFLPGQHAMCFGDIHKSCKNLFHYYEQLDRSYRPFRGIKKLPLTRRVQDARLEWAGDSYVEIATANTITSGRSYSIRHLQLDEYAFYRDAAALMTGVMQSVPDDPHTSIFALSTANGLGDAFYDLCMRVMAGDTAWQFIFFSCFEHPEYTRPLGQDGIDGARFQSSFDAEERLLHEREGITLAQLNWRRWTIQNKCEGSVDRFHQEYPWNPEQAFLTSGRPRFDGASLARMPIIRDPLVGGLEEQRLGTRTVIQFMPREHGELRVWKRPRPGRLYTIGADTALGRDVSEDATNPDPDYSVAQVHDIDDGEQVAMLRGRIEPDPFAEYLDALGRWFNYAFLVPEINFGSGIAVIEGLLRRQYPVGLIYQRRRDPHDRRAPSLQELGFDTNTVTKPQLISLLDRAIREASIVMRDAITLQEHRTFVYKANGKMEGQRRCHDDCVIGEGLAVVGISTAPRDLMRRMQAQMLHQPATNAPAQAPVGAVRYGRRRSAEPVDVL
jgi:hypothetical protein